MPVLSNYWFHDHFFGGTFDVWNQPYPNGGWAWISNGGASAATLVWNRPDGERVVDLAGQFNTSDVLAAIDGYLTGDASRTSGVMVQGVFWNEVPYRYQDPGRHNDWDMLVRAYVNFHVHTPWYCSDADGWIAFYLVIYLDGAGHVQGYVDGWWYSYNGGGPFCTGGINDALNAAGPQAASAVQGILTTKLALLSAFSFSDLYYLPGSGTSTPGSSSENADTDLAIAVLPA